MRTFLVLAVYLTSVFAAPPTIRIAPTGSIWDFHSSMLDDFEANLRRMRDEFDQLEKTLESGFKFDNIDGIVQNGTNLFNLDPKKMKNESFSDTKIVDGKVVHTEEKVIANGNSVVHFKKVEITPKGSSATPTGDKPKRPFDSPASPSTPEASPPSASKNDLDSEQVDNDEKTKPIEGSIFGDDKETPTRDVEEVENIQPLPLKVSGPMYDVNNELDEDDLEESSANLHPSTIVDLSGDTKVNEILSQNGASGGLIQPEPDAELVDVNTNNMNRPNYLYNSARRPMSNYYSPYYNQYEMQP